MLVCRGPTRKETKLSEAQSYANLIAENEYFGLLPQEIAETSTLIEDRALDSYQNILFSLTLFHSTFHCWPTHLTLISHAFKKHRLLDLHCGAIGFDVRRVRFVGIDPEGYDDEGDDGVRRAEEEWREDGHGRGEGLRGKRERRNVWGVWQGAFAEGVDEKGGLVTAGEGEEEILVDDTPRPWS